VQVSGVDARDHSLPARFAAFAWYLYLYRNNILDSIGDVHTLSDSNACMLNN